MQSYAIDPAIQMRMRKHVRTLNLELEGNFVMEVCSFSVGEKFARKIATYEKDRSVQLYRSDSRTLEAAGKRVPVEKAKKDLVYYSVTFSCVFGGKKYIDKRTGKRPVQRYEYLDVV